MIIRNAIIVAALAVSACTATPQMVENQKAKCQQIGYTPGTAAFMACVERGVQMGEAGQNAAASSIVSTGAALVIADALF